jgi:ABC-type sugar transport system ATPase subunit
LIGDNGAGKSTLVKILSGVYHMDEGQIYVEGKPVEFHGPVDAQRMAGISTVYQDLALVDVRDVGSNIYLNIEPTWLGIFINFRKLYADARDVINLLRIDLPSVKVNVGELSGGQRQAVAIARALARGQRIFLLDEPTAALGVEQQAKVTQLIADLKQSGKTIMVISHNLEHVFTVADRLVVLRHGRRVGTRIKSQTTKEEIVGLITGAVKGDVVD